MFDKLIGLFVGFLICKVLEGGADFLSNIFHVSHPSTGPAPSPSPTLTSTAVNFPTVTPAGLPPFPSGWTPATPPSPAMVSRAWALLPMMQMGEVKYEQGAGGEWLAFQKTKMGEKTGVVVYRTRGAASSSPMPSSAPSVPTSAPMGPVPASSSPMPGPVPMAAPSSSASSGPRPTLRRGSKGDWVKVWQRALGLNDDGSFGPGTDAATRSWQSAHGLKPDGKVGPQTWATVPAAAA